jgi:hypothetical protein
MGKGYMTIDNVDYNEIWNNFITPGVERYNEKDKTDLEALLAVWDDEQIKKYLVSQGNTFKKLAHIEQPDRQKMAKGKFQGLSEKFGTGFSFDEDFLKDAKEQDILDYQADLLEQDRDNIRLALLKTCMLTSTDGFFNGSFESNEGITAPPKYGANTFAAGHTHYITVGATTLDLGFCATARKHIREHGFQERLVGFVNSTDEEAVTKMLMPTSSSVKVSNPLTDQVAVEGYINRAGGIDWVSTELMPAGWGLVVATNPAVARRKPVRLIWPTNASFRGLRIIKGSDSDWPIRDAYYSRFMGAKVFHRAAGIAFQLTANASYTNPATSAF